MQATVYKFLVGVLIVVVAVHPAIGCHQLALVPLQINIAEVYNVTWIGYVSRFGLPVRQAEPAAPLPGSFYIAGRSFEAPVVGYVLLGSPQCNRVVAVLSVLSQVSQAVQKPAWPFGKTGDPNWLMLPAVQYAEVDDFEQLKVGSAEYSRYGLAVVVDDSLAVVRVLLVDCVALSCDLNELAFVEIGPHQLSPAVLNSRERQFELGD